MPEQGWHCPTLSLVKSQNSSAAQGPNVGLGDGTAVGAGVAVGANVPLPPPHAQHCTLAVKSASS